MAHSSSSLTHISRQIYLQPLSSETIFLVHTIFHSHNFLETFCHCFAISTVNIYLGSTGHSFMSSILQVHCPLFITLQLLLNNSHDWMGCCDWLKEWLAWMHWTSSLVGWLLHGLVNTQVVRWCLYTEVSRNTRTAVPFCRTWMYLVESTSVILTCLCGTCSIPSARAAASTRTATNGKQITLL